MRIAPWLTSFASAIRTRRVYASSQFARHRCSLWSLALVAWTFAGGVRTSRADVLYVGNSGNNTIDRFTSGGAGSVFVSSGLNNPIAVAFDGAGNLYAANTIEKVTPGGVGSVFASSGLSGPFGLAFDSAGNLYAANANSNPIEEYTPGGVGSVFVSTGLSGPRSLAFTNDAGVPLPLLNQIPEPASLGLLAVATAAFVSRRRHSSKGPLQVK